MLKKLFSNLLGSGAPQSAVQEVEPVEYKGYLIIPEPDNQSGQYRVSGWIRKPIEEGESLAHRFERSDMLPGRDACETMTITKAQRFIDEVGDDMFAPDPRQGSEP